MRITLQPSGKSFECNTEDTLLEAGLRAHIALPYVCKSGICGACKCRVTSGLVAMEGGSSSALSEDEIKSGHTLLCRARAKTSVEIDLEVRIPTRNIEAKTLPARVQSITKPASDIAILTLRIPKNESFDFLPGQYIDFLLPNGQRRSYSIADFKPEEQLIELHVRKVPGGAFSTQVHESLKAGDMIRFRGPNGMFFFATSARPIIMAATGTGFAPIKAMLKKLLKNTPAHPVYFYWGNRTWKDFYATQEIEEFSRQTSWLSFTPVLSRPENDNWPGAVGHIQDAIRRDHTNLSEFDIYACGSPIMISSLKTELTDIGLAENCFHADPFYAQNN